MSSDEGNDNFVAKSVQVANTQTTYKFQEQLSRTTSRQSIPLEKACVFHEGGDGWSAGNNPGAAFEDTAPLLLEQYCRFHIPGTDDGAALRQIRDGAVEPIVRKCPLELSQREDGATMVTACSAYDSNSLASLVIYVKRSR